MSNCFETKGTGIPDMEGGASAETAEVALAKVACPGQASPTNTPAINKTMLESMETDFPGFPARAKAVIDGGAEGTILALNDVYGFAAYKYLESGRDGIYDNPKSEAPLPFFAAMLHSDCIRAIERICKECHVGFPTARAGMAMAIAYTLEIDLRGEPPQNLDGADDL